MMPARALIVVMALQPVLLEAGGPFRGLPFKPAHIAHAVQKAKDEVAKTTPDVVASSLKNTKVNIGDLGGKAEEAHDKLINSMPGAVQKTHEEFHSAEQQHGGAVQQAAQQAVAAVGVAVDQSREVISGVGVSAEDVARGDVAAVGGQVAEVARTVDKVGLASQLRVAAPQMAMSLNRTSLQVASALAITGSQAAFLVNHSGHFLAGRIEGKKENPLPFELPDLTEVPERTWVASSGVLLLGAIGCMAYAGVCVKKKVTEARQPPVVLRETLMEDASDGPMRAEDRGPAFEPPQHVPLVG